MFTQTKQLCELFLKMGIPGFDLIVYRGGRCVLRHMAGYADKENKLPIRGKERYHIFSCSKLFTCVAAMQLWEQGAFRLEDRLSDYIPEFADVTVKSPQGPQRAKNPILIRHLFEMTSGMNYDLHAPVMEQYFAQNPACPTVDTVRQMARIPLEFQPGEGWRYSLSHDVLAALVELLSGQRFEDYVKAHIFEPLGMIHSDFLHPMEDWAGFAQLYRYEQATRQYQPWRHNIYRPGEAYASGGAGCVSTVEDYIKFLEALRIGDVLLKKQTVAMMAKDRLTDRQRAMFSYDSVNTGYGLGMRTPRAGGWHTEFGWGGAAGAFASVDPVNDVTIYYAQHVLLTPNMSLRTRIYEAVIADIRGEEFRLPSEAIPNDFSITY